MNKKIKSWALLGLIATLGACGGSDTVTTTSTDTTDTTDTPDTVDTVTDVDNDNLALSAGLGDDYEAGVASIGIGSSSTLSASGSTTITVYVVNTESKEEFLGSRDVFFTSTCAQVGLAEFTPSQLKVSGVATATYQDKGCGKATGNTDSVVVTLGTQDTEGSVTEIATAKASLTVEAAEVSAIQFTQAEPLLIALNGFGTAETPSLSTIEFQMVDVSGNPMPDRTVDFELDHDFGSAALSLDKAITNQEGKVLVMLNAGNVPGTVRIKASINVEGEGSEPDRTVSTFSAPIVMATSLGDQNSFTLSASEFNPHAWDVSGTQVTITAHLGDQNQNPVLDGTSIYFTATGGMIKSSCETTNGSCPVTWTSANPAPADGYVTILAHTRAQGNFQDENANGLFDLGESFEAFGEAWVDANGNGTYETDGAYQPDLDIDGDGNNDFHWGADDYTVYVDSSSDNSGVYAKGSSNFFEKYVESNNNGVFDLTPAIKYQGVNCSQGALDAGHCAELVDVTKSLRLQMSAGNDALIEGPFEYDAGTGRYDKAVSCVNGDGAVHRIAWRVADSFSRRNHPALGTKITAVSDDVEIKYEFGTGTVPNLHPVSVLPVYKIASGLTGEALKYKYLNDRGIQILVDVTEPETAPANSPGYGTLNLEVELLSGAKEPSSPLQVRIDGSACP